MNGRKARDRRHLLARQRRQIFGDDEQFVGIIVGWCGSDGTLAETRTQLHDRLIELLGDTRRGPVSWVWSNNDDESFRMLDTLVRTETEQVMFDHYRRIRALVRESGGHVVIARADAEPPVGDGVLRDQA